MKIQGVQFLTLAWVSSLAFAMSCSKGDDQSGAAAAGGIDVQKFTQSPHLVLDGKQDEIFQLNVDKVRRVSFYAKVRDAIFENPDRKAWLEALRKSLQMDPLDKVERVVAGMEEPLDLEDPLKNAVLVMVGDFGDPMEFMNGLRGFALERYFSSAPDVIKSETDYPGVHLYSIMGAEIKDSPGKTQDYYAVFLGERVLLFSRTRTQVVRCLEVAAGKSPDMNANPKWQSRLAKAPFNALVWGMGKTPKVINEKIKEQVNTEPELKQLFFLHDTSEFNISLGFDGSDYTFKGAFSCEEAFRSKGVRDNLEEMRRRGYIPKLIARFAGEGAPSIPVWESLFDNLTFSVGPDAALVDLNMPKSDMEQWIKDLLNPPKPDNDSGDGA